MKTYIKQFLAVLALVLVGLTAEAQVKIGSNATTPNPNANFEVEATDGHKVIVNKAIGTVQVENLPIGAKTDSLVVADPTGVLKQSSLQKLLPTAFPRAKMRGGIQNQPNGVFTDIDFTTVDFDSFGGADVVGNKFVIPESGWYAYTVRQYAFPINGTPGNWNIYVKKNNVTFITVTTPYVGNAYSNAYFGDTEYFNKNDVITLQILTSNGVTWEINNTTMIIERKF